VLAGKGDTADLWHRRLTGCDGIEVPSQAWFVAARHRDRRRIFGVKHARSGRRSWRSRRARAFVLETPDDVAQRDNARTAPAPRLVTRVTSGPKRRADMGCLDQGDMRRAPTASMLVGDAWS
jgi:hypothetical protein